ncbi:HesA/MoeB/ThiF family protein [Aquimarina sp. U1-2]|uniref:HesA/MoeB/ThiF family protein n=1 Tax=Aquimarina sp. U1-2 TaxID=2823141 RepID=UPI001AECFAE9|nr:HesA/MoeB/ThiF family protein [Aquimarina sp. U1-2]MBP2831504.1 HesA/MoeB/ThiF family protein [Aquimarina sp. U1-2]
MSISNTRYHRQIILPEIGTEGQEKLTASKVLVIGAGGLGCPILQYLAAAGVGTIGIIDFDRVETSNLHRQILYGQTAVGEHKAIAAQHRLEDLNPEIHTIAYPEKLSTTNALSYFSEYDIIVDGTDNFSTRYLISDACVIANKPLVYGAIFKFEGQVSVFNYKNGPTYRCLFPDPPRTGSVPSCAEIGVLGVLPGIIGSLQANEVLKIILGIGEILNGKLLVYDSLTTRFSTFSIQRIESEVEKVINLADQFKTMDYDFFCGIKTIKEVTPEDITSTKNSTLIDVRETSEQPRLKHLNAISIPLRVLSKKLTTLDKDKEIVVFCQSGIRSKKAAALLLDNGFTNVAHLKGGALALHNHKPLSKV